MNVEALLRVWDGEELILRHDRETNAWIIIAIHSTVCGPATGGTRMRAYPDLATAIQYAQSLARSMTFKFAIAEFPRGGGKGVIATPPGLSSPQRSELLHHYGSLLQQLGGLFRTGPDVGTSPVDMDVIAETGAPFVHGLSTIAGGAGDSGPATALGVFQAIQSTIKYATGSADIHGCRILVQGVGSVGARLARRLHAAGAEVLVSDIDTERVRDLAKELGVEVVPSARVYETACMIWSPCALGGELNAATIPELRCAGVAGAANNQLATPEDAGLLRDRGILYAPDFIANLGGALAITGQETLGWSENEAQSQVRRAIAEALTEVFIGTERDHVTTEEAARHLALERLRASS